MKPKSLILISALLLTALLCAAPVAADAVTYSGKTYTTYDQIYASTTLSSSEKLSLVQEMAGWTEELAAYMEWKNSGGLEAYQAAVSGGNSTSGDYGWDEAPGDGLGDGSTSIEPEYSYQERQAYDAAYAAYQAEFAAGYDYARATGASGSGTEADPYIISSASDWNSINPSTIAWYALSNDINGDLIQIGSIDSGNLGSFRGSIDGRGFCVNYGGKTFSTATYNTHIGALIYADTDYSTIKNIKFSNAALNYPGQYSGTSVIYGCSNLDNVIIDDMEIIGGAYATTISTIDASNIFVNNVDLIKQYNFYMNGWGASNLIATSYIVNPSSIVNSVILDSDYTSTNTQIPIYRISYPNTITLSNNYAGDNVLIRGSTVTSSDANSANGATITATQYNSESWWKTTMSMWDWENVWQWNSETNLPELRNANNQAAPPTITSITATPSIGGQQDTYTLSVSATTEAAGGIASYQWYGRIGSSGEWQAISDGTSATYQFTPGAYALGDFYFKCVITGADGGVIDSYNAGFTNVKVTVVLAPQITSPAATPATGPLSQTITLSADVTSTETATYQWQELIGSTWTNISGATAATATVNIADTAATTHSYRLQATNVGGTSTSATVTYTSVAPPAISSVTANPTTGPLTQSVTLSASVSGATSYQWQEQSGSTWQNIAGATSATYTANIADSAATTHSYRLLATNVGGTTTSATVAYTSVAAPTISSVTANPTTGPLTQSVTLSATVSGATSYQWQKQSGSTWQNIQGATSATYTANIADSAATTHTYRLQATNIGGTTTSASVTYTSVLPPTINTVSATPASGPLSQTVTLTVSATGAAQYQWQQLTGTTWNNINGATASTHTVTISDNAPTLHSYRVVVSNVGGSITSDTVTYQSSTGPIINTISATPASGPLTQTVQLSVTATSTNTISYQWQELIGNTWTAISGATTPTYSVSITDTNPTTHSYRVLATDIGGTTPSETITYTSIAPPNIQAININPAVGKYTETITLSAEVSGADTYQWQQNTGTTWNNISGATTVPWIGTLTVTGDTQYRLLATNAGGTTTSQTIQYTIAGPANIQSLTATPSVITLPGSTTLSATGSNVISWEWQQYTSGVWTPIGYSASVTQRFTDAGTYQFRVLATGADGAVVTSETIEVIAGFAPSVSITSPNDGTRYQSGERIPLTATITGTDPTWEWSFGSQDVQTGGNSQTTWVEYGIDGRYTISIRVVSLFGTDEDSITIISGRESRPIATTPPIELESDGIFEATDSLTPNENGMPDITGFIMSMSKPFTDMIGAWFYFVLFAVPYLIIWIRQKNIIIPSILGVLFAAWVLIQLPAAALPAAIALITLSVTGGLYGIYVKLQNR